MDSHVKRVYAAAMQRFGTIDVIVNNAGLRQRDLYPPSGAITLIETEVDDWQRMFDTHVFGAVRVIKTFGQPMLEKRRGSIINVCSGGWRDEGRASREMPYKSAKAAVADLTFYLSHELAPYNIAANLLLPGHTRTTGSDEQEAGARGAARAGRARRRHGTHAAHAAGARRAAGALSRSRTRAASPVRRSSRRAGSKRTAVGAPEAWAYAGDLTVQAMRALYSVACYLGPAAGLPLCARR